MKHTLWMFAIAGTLLMANSSKQDDKTGLIWQDNQEITVLKYVMMEGIGHQHFL
jgi:hypothetical protein